ncbi:MAG TPA: hypothetical protein DD789_12000 [Firmicutes bacterium]|nr:hypothetical protein [Bacillota bacterium]
MQLLPTLPWLVKILVSLVLIILANSLLKRLSLAMALGSLALALFAGHTPAQMLAITGNQIFNVKHLNFLLVIALVYWLSHQMSASGLMQDLVKLIQGRLSQRDSFLVLPMLIGLLPVPAGALFSAPLVDSCDQEKKLKPELKSAINFWFRHPWEYCSPMYPAPLLAMEIAALSLLQFLWVGLPLALISLVAGYLLLRQVPAQGRSCQSPQPGFFRQLLALITPILIVVSAYIIYQLIPAAIRWDNNYFPISLGVIGGILWLQRARPLPIAQWRPILFQKKILTLALQMSMIRVYGAFIETKLPDGSSLVANFSAELTSYGIPVILMVMLIPFVSALATGLAVGYIGASFPIIISLLGPSPSFAALLAHLVLAQGFGMIGVMLSPVHVCHLVSNEYFETELSRSTRLLLAPSALVLLGSILLYLLYSLVF